VKGLGLGRGVVNALKSFNKCMNNKKLTNEGDKNSPSPLPQM